MSKKNKFTKDFSYPEPEDPELLAKIFKKREFYYHRVPQRAIMETYDDVKKYRALNCKQGEIEPREQQAIIPNYISTNTPYKGVILMHGVGSGKTMTAIRVAEQFKDQVKKYNTKIYVLVPGPNTRENFKKELLTTTGETYLKNKEALNQMTKNDIEKEKKNAIYSALQYYKILSYKTFYKKVLGEKIVEKKIVGDSKIKSSYRKNTEGEYEREIVVDRINNMNNAILIVDEAHNISGNEYGEALKKIIKNSENLRVILLTATPMINLADEIVDLLNFIRPLNDQIQRDKIFTSEKNYAMKIKPGGLEYLKNKAVGYISFYRGSIPFTFAKRVEKGVIPNGMLFTPVIKCFMEPFQYKTYLETTTNVDDTLDRASSAASNFVFPGLSEDKNKLVGYYSTEGMKTVISQIKTDGDKLRSLIKKLINDASDNKISDAEKENIIFENEKNNITGLILNLKYIKLFSVKFYNILTRLNKLVIDKKGPATAFVYSNLVKAGGMELFAETLLQNGYLEYQDDTRNYDIKDETIDYKTGLTYSEFKKKKLSDFRPATFILVTGGSDDAGEDIPEIKQKIIQEVFNSPNNTDGKMIKFVLGSRVMNEGVTLKNVKEVHIIDVFFNIPKAEQVIGRAIRMCVHEDVINDDYKYPQVNVYRYVVALSNKNKNDLSTDELLYQKAEIKYLTVKEVERALKEVSIDCPLLLHANMFPEELKEYSNCVYPTLENVASGKQICPALCDFKKCNLKCDSHKLNEVYWDAKKNSYKKLDKNEINYNTFNDDLAKYEISLIKNRIKDLYRFKHVYMYDEIIVEIKKSFIQHQAELFEDYFLDQALEDMMPKTENDFNNYKDTIYDKYNRGGYLIQRGKYFIFQPFNENEDAPMYYRQHMEIEQNNQVSLNNYVKQKFKTQYKKNDLEQKEDLSNNIEGYNFDDTFDYYDERKENFIVGIIDKNLNKLASTDLDLFKIRPKRAKILDKKRGTGIPTFKGAVCSTSKDKEYLMKLVKKMPNNTEKEVMRINKLTRELICLEIKEKLLYLEKYSTTKDDNKMTYIMIPINHPIYKFPYNLEDRIKYYIKNINKLAGKSIDILVKKQKDKKDNFMYEMSFLNDKNIKEITNEIQKLGFVLKDNKWICILD
jgi:DNA polymerase III delta prime subunit